MAGAKMGVMLGAATLLLAAGAQAQEKASVRLKWLTQAQFAGFYVAKEKGFYLAEGIDLTINPGGPNLNAESLVASGADQFGQGGGVESQLSSRDKSLPVVAIGMMHQKTPYVFVTYADSGINSLKDFKGKKVSVWFTGAQYTLYATLATAGVAPTDLTVMPQQVSLTPFIDRQVDVATATLYNEFNVLKARGITDLKTFAPDDFGIKVQRDTLITTEALIKDKPKLVQGFMNATLKGWKYSFQNKAEAIDILMKVAPNLERPHQEKMLVAIEEVTLAGAGTAKGIGAIDLPAIEGAHKILLEAKVLNAPVDMKTAFDSRFWDAVPAELKKM